MGKKRNKSKVNREEIPGKIPEKIEKITGQLTYDRFIRKFDEFNLNDSDSDSISQKALNILIKNRVKSKYKLIYPLFKNFSFHANSITLGGFSESPLWALDSNDVGLKTRINNHYSYNRGITDEYCASTMGSSVLVVQRGSIGKSVKVKKQGIDEGSYKIHLETERKITLSISRAEFEDVEGSNQVPLDDIKIQYENDDALRNELSNNQSLLESVKSLYPIVYDGRYVTYYFYPSNVVTRRGKYGFGGIFVIAEHYLDRSEKSFFMMMAYAMSNKVALKQDKNMRIAETVKSVKAAIMSRNMSHNLGSHIMSYLNQNLSSVQEMINTRSLCNLVNRDNFNVNSSVDSIEMPFLIGVGKFIKYIQERQDYIATVSTDYVPYSSSVNFKDFIFDELNADLRFLRHKGDRSGCQPLNILLGNIAKSEGYNREDIHINFRNFDGGIKLLHFEEPLVSEENPELPNKKLEKELSDAEAKLRNELQKDRDLEILRTFNVSLPGGVIGRQAIFSIVENIIRNAAKHGKFSIEDKHLDVKFDLLDLNDQNVVNNINDDYRQLLISNKYFDESNKNRYYIFTITNNQKVDDVTISSLNAALKECYVNYDGRLNNSNKGIKEMRISAAWLRNIHDDNDAETLANTPEPPIIMVDNTEAFLRYTMCLSKAFKVALIVDSREENSINEEKILEKYSWRVFTIDEWIKPTTNKEYEIIIVTRNISEQIKDISPNRLLVIEEEYQTIINGIRTETENIQQYLDDKYIGYWRSIVKPQEDDIIYINDLSSFESSKDKGGIPVIEKINGKEKVAEYRFEGSSKGQCMVKVFGDLPLNYLKKRYKEAKYIYRKHHASKSEIDQYFEHFITEKTRFIEGITGHNSTDRLVRNEDITELWYLKHLHAAKTRVAIFDERIFRKLAIREEKNIIEKLEASNGEIECSNIVTIVYAHKQISVYTIVPVNSGKKEFVILGLCCEKDNVRIRKIGSISFLDDEFCIEISFAVEKNDYLSVHQGLLDKLYEAIPYTVRSDRTEYDDKRIQLTNKLKEIFCNDKSRMLIHSGRSIPSDRDMPQKHVPFVQFATIENALEDAKLTLVELLDFARCDS